MSKSNRDIKRLIYDLQHWTQAVAAPQDLMAEAAQKLETLTNDADKFWRMAERCKENYFVATKENAQFRRLLYVKNIHVRFPSADADVEKLIELHNDARAKRSWFKTLRSLTRHEKLMDYAQSHAFKMADGGWLRHSSMDNVLKLGFTAAGENIAWGQNSEESVLNSWLWSYTHRANILSNKYDSIGCGARKDKAGRLYWCVVFGKLKPQTVTQL